MPGIEIKIVDENRNEIASSIDNPGKVMVKGDMVMKGYWNNEEATKNAIKDGWLVINDYGYIDDKGYVYILGRADDVININGEKVSPLEIEEAANLFEGVSESCCIGVDDPLGLGRQVPVLYVTMKENTSFSEKEIQAHLSKHLEKYKLPYKIICIDEIPVNERGKYLRRELALLWRESAVNIL
jgi:long-chain acyl-CoA synthetase